MRPQALAARTPAHRIRAVPESPWPHARRRGLPRPGRCRRPKRMARASGCATTSHRRTRRRCCPTALRKTTLMATRCPVPDCRPLARWTLGAAPLRSLGGTCCRSSRCPEPSWPTASPAAALGGQGAGTAVPLDRVARPGAPSDCAGGWRKQHQDARAGGTDETWGAVLLNKSSWCSAQLQLADAPAPCMGAEVQGHQASPAAGPVVVSGRAGLDAAWSACRPGRPTARRRLFQHQLGAPRRQRRQPRLPLALSSRVLGFLKRRGELLDLRTRLHTSRGSRVELACCARWAPHRALPSNPPAA